MASLIDLDGMSHRGAARVKTTRATTARSFVGGHGPSWLHAERCEGLAAQFAAIFVVAIFFQSRLCFAFLRVQREQDLRHVLAARHLAEHAVAFQMGQKNSLLVPEYPLPADFAAAHGDLVGLVEHCFLEGLGDPFQQVGVRVLVFLGDDLECAEHDEVWIFDSSGAKSLSHPELAVVIFVSISPTTTTLGCRAKLKISAGSKFQNMPGRWTCDLLPKSVLPDYEAMLKMRPESRDTINMFGKTHPLPRFQQAYATDTKIKYKYSGISLDTKAVPLELTTILWYLNMNKKEEEKYNFILVNWYMSGRDYVSSHSDNEASIDQRIPIATVSLGATRVFRIRDSKSGKKVLDKPLEHGSIFFMKGAGFQEKFKHEVVKTKKIVGPRVSLTFRRMIVDDPVAVDQPAKKKRRMHE